MFRVTRTFPPWVVAVLLLFLVPGLCGTLARVNAASAQSSDTAPISDDEVWSILTAAAKVEEASPYPSCGDPVGAVRARLVTPDTYQGADMIVANGPSCFRPLFTEFWTAAAQPYATIADDEEYCRAICAVPAVHFGITGSDPTVQNHVDELAPFRCTDESSCSLRARLHSDHVASYAPSAQGGRDRMRRNVAHRRANRFLDCSCCAISGYQVLQYWCSAELSPMITVTTTTTTATSSATDSDGSQVVASIYNECRPTYGTGRVVECSHRDVWNQVTATQLFKNEDLHSFVASRTTCAHFPSNETALDFVMCCDSIDALRAFADGDMEAACTRFTPLSLNDNVVQPHGGDDRAKPIASTVITSCGLLRVCDSDGMHCEEWAPLDRGNSLSLHLDLEATVCDLVTNSSLPACFAATAGACEADPNCVSFAPCSAAVARAHGLALPTVFPSACSCTDVGANVTTLVSLHPLGVRVQHNDLDFWLRCALGSCNAFSAVTTLDAFSCTIVLSDGAPTAALCWRPGTVLDVGADVEVDPHLLQERITFHRCDVVDSLVPRITLLEPLACALAAEGKRYDCSGRVDVSAVSGDSSGSSDDDDATGTSLVDPLPPSLQLTDVCVSIRTAALRSCLVDPTQPQCSPTHLAHFAHVDGCVPMGERAGLTRDYLCARRHVHLRHIEYVRTPCRCALNLVDDPACEQGATCESVFSDGAVVQHTVVAPSAAKRARYVDDTTSALWACSQCGRDPDDVRCRFCRVCADAASSDLEACQCLDQTKGDDPVLAQVPCVREPCVTPETRSGCTALDQTCERIDSNDAIIMEFRPAPRSREPLLRHSYRMTGATTDVSMSLEHASLLEPSTLDARVSVMEVCAFLDVNGDDRYGTDEAETAVCATQLVPASRTSFADHVVPSVVVDRTLLVSQLAGSPAANVGCLAVHARTPCQPFLADEGYVVEPGSLDADLLVNPRACFGVMNSTVDCLRKVVVRFLFEVSDEALVVSLDEDDGEKWRVLVTPATNATAGKQWATRLRYSIGKRIFVPTGDPNDGRLGTNVPTQVALRQHASGHIVDAVFTYPILACLDANIVLDPEIVPGYTSGASARHPKTTRIVVWMILVITFMLSLCVC